MRYHGRMPLTGRRIAIVTHYFPPIGGPGAVRMAGWAEALAEAGAEVHVIVPEASAQDPFLSSGWQLDHPRIHLHPTARRDLAGRARRSGGTAEEQQNAGGGLRRHLALRIRDMLELPDHRRTWNPVATAALKRLQPAPDTVITTSPYGSTHLIGLRWRQRNPQGFWLADFRDRWIQHAARRRWTPLHRAYLLRLESRILAGADHLSWFHDWAVSDAASRHPGLALRPKSTPIWNGVPPGTWDRLTEPNRPMFDPRPRPWRVVYAGTLWDWNVPPGFLEAWRRFRLRLGGAAELQIIGRADPEARLALGGPQAGHEGIVFHGLVPPAQIPDLLLGAQTLLVLSGPHPEAVSSKLFETAAAERPVLYFGLPDSPGAETLRALGAAKACATAWTAAATMAQWTALADAIEAGPSALRPFMPEHVPTNFRREAQTDRLVRLLAARRPTPA